MNRRKAMSTMGAAALLAAWRRPGGVVRGQAPAQRTTLAQVPIFEYDPTFPKPMKETWAIGPIGGLAVDRQDHLFVVHRPGGLLTNERFSGAEGRLLWQQAR